MNIVSCGTPQASVLFVDECAILVEAVVQEISKQSGLVAFGGHGVDGVPKDHGGLKNPAIAILDPSQSDRSPAELREHYADVLGAEEVIAYLPSEHTRTARECLHAEFSGVLSRASSADQLRAAVMCVQEGGIFVDGCFGDFQNARALGAPDGMEGLTAREQTVLGRVAVGSSSKEVARELGISPKTVDTHRCRAMSKLGLIGRAALIDHARTHAWS